MWISLNTFQRKQEIRALLTASCLTATALSLHAIVTTTGPFMDPNALAVYLVLHVPLIRQLRVEIGYPLLRNIWNAALFSIIIALFRLPLHLPKSFPLWQPTLAEGAAALLFMSALFLLIRTLSSSKVRKPQKRIAQGLWESLMLIAVGLLFVPRDLALWTPLVILIGVSVAHYHIHADERRQSQQFKSFHLNRALHLPFALILFTFIGFSSWGSARHVMADHALAQGELVAATQSFPWDDRYWNVSAEAHFEEALNESDSAIVLERLQRAENGYGEAIQLSPFNPNYHARLATIHLAYADVSEQEGQRTEATERRGKALSTYRYTVDLAPRDSKLNYDYAQVLLRLNHTDEAWNQFLHVLTLDPSYQDVNYQLARLATERQDYDVAREYLQQALQDDPSNEDTKALLQRINKETEV